MNYNEYIKTAEKLTTANAASLVGKTIEWTHDVARGNVRRIEKGKVLAVKGDRIVLECVAGAPKSKFDLPEGTVFTHENIFLTAEGFYACGDADLPVYFKIAE